MNNLTKIRKDKNLTLREVADGAKISESYYCMIENGKRRPSVQVAKRIAKVLDFNWTRFYDEVDELLKNA